MLLIAQFSFFIALQVIVQCQINPTIELTTNSFIQSSGCNSSRLQSGEQGSFSSINYPQHYNNRWYCEWFINVPAKKMIKLTFNVDFAIEKKSRIGCYDSVSVFQGSNTNSEKIGEYCGTIAPNPRLVNSSQVFVTFKSDLSNQFKGFSLRWETVDRVVYELIVKQQSGCKSKMYQLGQKGTFSSINYPQNYDINSTCVWYIIVPLNKIIKLTFNDNFGLEKDSITGHCYDSVSVYKGLSTNSENIGVYCGAVAPGTIFVNSNQARLIFQSDSSTQLKGFSVQWEAVEVGQSGCKSPRLQFGMQGNFNSINYPQNYDSNSYCEWLIIVPATHIIKLTFNVDFAIENIISRCYDAVNVFQGSNAYSGKIAEYCGTVAPDPMFVRSNQAFVTFKSGLSGQRKGFTVRWEAVDKIMYESTDGYPSGCASLRMQSGKQGTFHSANYPQNYYNNLTCEWFINVSIKKIIKMTFNKNFEVEKSHDIEKCYDSVSVFKGSNANKEKIGEYCGTVAPDPMFVNSNEAVVTFKSDFAIPLKGFSVQWEAVDQLTNKSTEIKTINKLFAVMMFLIVIANCNR